MPFISALFSYLASLILPTGAGYVLDYICVIIFSTCMLHFLTSASASC